MFDQATTFYISNLPRDCKKIVLWRIFANLDPTQQNVKQGNLEALDVDHQEEAHTGSLGVLATPKETHQGSLEALDNNVFSPQSKDGSPKLELRGKLGPSLQPSSIPDECPSRASAETNRESEADQRGTMERGRNTHVKSLAEISCTKLVIGGSGRRSKRVPRHMLTTGEKQSTPPNNEAGSGITLHDSQIVNMNRVFCTKAPNPESMEQSPTPEQISGSLAQIGVKGNVAAEEIIHRI
ncbi:hypothetical protein Ancab_002655 [Ancistrocladus abbreviatus]